MTPYNLSRGLLDLTCVTSVMTHLIPDYRVVNLNWWLTEGEHKDTLDVVSHWMRHGVCQDKDLAAKPGIIHKDAVMHLGAILDRKVSNLPDRVLQRVLVYLVTLWFTPYSIKTTALSLNNFSHVLGVYSRV